MSAKKKGLELMLFESRPKVGNYQLFPMTAGRMVVLEDVGNPLIGALKEGDEVPKEAVFELLMVATMEPVALARLSREGPEAWQDAVDLFGMELPNSVLEEIWGLVQKEFAAIQKARAVPKKKARG